jgi:hypothetical protein
MTLIAASGPATLIPIVFALACPLMMILMIRGHGHGHGGHAHRADEMSRGPMTLEELERRRDELNEEIAERAEQALDSGYRGAQR